MIVKTGPLTVIARTARHGLDPEHHGILMVTAAGRLWLPLEYVHTAADALVDLAEQLEANAAAAGAWRAGGERVGAA